MRHTVPHWVEAGCRRSVLEPSRRSPLHSDVEQTSAVGLDPRLQLQHAAWLPLIPTPRRTKHASTTPFPGGGSHCSDCGIRAPRISPEAFSTVLKPHTWGSKWRYLWDAEGPQICCSVFDQARKRSIPSLDRPTRGTLHRDIPSAC